MSQARWQCHGRKLPLGTKLGIEMQDHDAGASADGMRISQNPHNTSPPPDPVLQSLTLKGTGIMQWAPLYSRLDQPTHFCDHDVLQSCAS